ncbi:NUDIX hydrolase [Streptomyces hoynatensis]|uniref:NUDIX domain-containing protein n=1 Tax=Streptomyces hoynatensis TaxID=1141874 RepID=A0A3A9YZ36_9ACTN|nr:NUDIX domain-containing protein [Streptomyces hoynatensis]RKN40944.1 NUDIX domain-containing protein [Streptomyces hoynatensis]
MDVVETWTGATAAALQDAMRMTNESFAAHLGIAVRTVATWNAQPEIIPRPDMQQVLDTTLERAGEAVKRRFALLSRPGDAVTAQALRVAIAVVIRPGEVLLVCRRDGDALRWQFPAGVVKPGADPEAVAVQETHAETGVHCSVRRQLGQRLHPVTGVEAVYHLADYLAGEATNRDPIENTDVTWAPISVLTRFIPADRIFPPILTALETA